jgi:hypothetical protein|tara:strand:+ start:255 stop:530 length:276 start_codon:yes stop_codon:yes gene_type:complete
MAKMPTKLGALIKRFGVGKGSGEYVAKQTGVKAMKTVVPLALGVMVLGAAAPTLAASIGGSVATVPVLGPLTAATINAGTSIRTRFGFNGQ